MPHEKPVSSLRGKIEELQNRLIITGEMRLGGMTPASIIHRLPATFRISDAHVLTDHVILFCDHNAEEGEELIWLDQSTIAIKGVNITLVGYPSHRTQWDTFTINRSDWE